MDALFEKRLDGFGELFRMLSFEEIGSAAMMSRATAGTVGAKAVFVLPGSEHAVRLAMSRLIVPELGHVAQQLQKSLMMMRPFQSTIPLDDAQEIIARGREPLDAHRDACRCARRAAACSRATVDGARRRAAVRARGDGRLRGARRRHRRRHARRAGAR